jgi:hypothetical protein
MKKNLFLIFVLVFYVAISPKSANGQNTEWNGYRITYVGPTQISKTLDGYKNSVVQVENLSNTSGLPLYFDVFIEGLVAENQQRNVHGEYGFAIFPNGGAVKINPGEKTFTQTWLNGVYEDQQQVLLKPINFIFYLLKVIMLDCMDLTPKCPQHWICQYH